MGNNMPLAVNNWNCYIGDSVKPLKATSLELPEAAVMSTETNLSGMLGKLNVPLTGHFDTMEATITAPVATIEMIEAAVPAGNMITARAAVETLDAATGQKSITPHTVVMRGSMSSFKPGNFEKAAPMDTALKFELDYLHIMINGESQFELDKLNGTFKVKGQDMMAAIRDAI